MTFLPLTRNKRESRAYNFYVVQFPGTEVPFVHGEVPAGAHVLAGADTAEAAERLCLDIEINGTRRARSLRLHIFLVLLLIVATYSSYVS